MTCRNYRVTEAVSAEALKVKWSHLGRLALAFKGATQVVHDDARAARAKEVSVSFAQTTTGSGDDNHAAIVSKLVTHGEVMTALKIEGCSAPLFSAILSQRPRLD